MSPSVSTLFTSKDFKKEMNVSDSVLIALGAYASALEEWQLKLNLVGPKTLVEVWHRHFFDSAQLIDHIYPFDSQVADIGTGAGFPGIVLSILGVPNVTLIESDGRKILFLREVIRICKTNTQIIHSRIERLTDAQFKIITARALAPLPKMLHLCHTLIDDDGYFLFLKGESFPRELTNALKRWNMQVENFPSRTHPNGAIVKIEKLKLR